MKRSLAWLAGIVGIAALGRWLARRKEPHPPVEQPDAARDVADEAVVDPATDPAEELRRKLEATRQHDAAAEPEPEPEQVETLEERRARVHAKAREAMNAMNDDSPAA